MAEIEVEESFETTTVRRKTVKQSFQIEEVSNLSVYKTQVHALEKISIIKCAPDNVHRSMHYL
jgi:hypothetical protein